MSEWVITCNGGPNDCTVGGRSKSLNAACGLLRKMMRALGASIGQIQRAPPGQMLVDNHPVETEKEAEPRFVQGKKPPMED